MFAIDNLVTIDVNEASEMGFNRGFNIASWIDIPEIGYELPKHIDWVGVGTIESEEDQIEAMELMAYDSEENDRQFTPFEFTAHDFNEAENSEELWEAFDEGINKGIRDNISKRFS